MNLKLLKTFFLFISMSLASITFAQEILNTETVVDCTCPGNLIQNPSFENVSSGSNLANWTTTTGNATRVSGTLVQSCPNLKVCGTYIGAIGNPSGSYTGAGTSSTYQEITLSANSNYNFSVYAGRTDAGCTPTIKLIFYNGTTQISGETKTISVTKNAYVDCALANYTLSGNAPANTTKVRIELRTTCGYLKVDAMCFTSTPTDCACVNASNNILVNPSFENALGSEWVASNGTIGSSTTYRACGNQGVVLTHSSGTAKIRQTVNISSTMPIGSNITFSAYAGTHSAGQNCSPGLIIEYYRANNSLIGSATATPITRNVDVAPIDVLAPFSVTGTIPAETAYIRVGASITCDYIKFDATCLKINCIPKFAGTDKEVKICENNLASINLNDVLTDEDAGGVWTINGQTVSNIFTPMAGASTTVCTYTVNSGNCGSDASTVTIIVVPKADAGADKTYEVCDNAIAQINLNDILTDEQTGGSWTMNGNPISNLYTPTSGTVVLTYTITGTTPCADDQSTVTVTVYPNSISVNAGPDGEVCAHAAASGLPIKTFQLTGQIGGGATSATWSDNGAGGSFSPDANTLDAIYTPPVGVNTITLTLTTNDPTGPCGAKSDFLILTEIACAGILDPCTCNQVTYNPTEVMEVKDFIEIDGNPGDIWRITVNGGGTNASNGGLPYGTMQQLDPAGLVTTNVDFPIGTVIPEISAGLFKLDFAHDSGKGYTVTVRNDVTGQQLSISNYCIITTFAPTFSVGATLCVDADPINLAETITDGTPSDATGSVDYYYIDSNGMEVPITTAFNPALYPVGAVVQIFGRYTPNNVIDCEIIKEATNKITIISCALPVDLISFSGKVNNETIALNWKTTNEKEFSHYEIQKSANAVEYASVGNVPANKSSYYNYIDNDPNSQNNYYRLKMVNNDGTFNFSHAINVNFENGKAFVNVENPSKNGEFVISTGLKNPTFTVLNSTGSKIQISTISNGANRFVVKPIQAPSGLYFLNIVSEGKIITKKVIVP